LKEINYFNVKFNSRSVAFITEIMFDPSTRGCREWLDDYTRPVCYCRRRSNYTERQQHTNSCVHSTHSGKHVSGSRPTGNVL